MLLLVKGRDGTQGQENKIRLRDVTLCLWDKRGVNFWNY